LNKTASLIFISLFFCKLFSQSLLSDNDKMYIDYIEDNILNENKINIAKTVTYPIYRPYPLKPIYNEEQFLNYYNILFDSEFISNFSDNSNYKNWNQVGWRGLMFNNGDLWLSHHGNIFSINYCSEYEKNLRQIKINNFGKKLNSNIRDFSNPIAFIETQSYYILVDYTNSGYRYISWNKPREIIDTPNLVVENGNIEQDGQLGNFFMSFNNGTYKYILEGNGRLFQIDILYVERNDKKIIQEQCITKWDIE